MFDHSLDRVNVAVVSIAVVAFFALVFGAVVHYNATERDRSVACSKAGGSYAEGRCDIR